MDSLLFPSIHPLNMQKITVLIPSKIKYFGLKSLVVEVVFKRQPGTSFKDYSTSRNDDQIDPLKIIYLIPKINLHNT